MSRPTGCYRTISRPANRRQRHDARIITIELEQRAEAESLHVSFGRLRSRDCGEAGQLRSLGHSQRNARRRPLRRRSPARRGCQRAGSCAKRAECGPGCEELAGQRLVARTPLARAIWQARRRHGYDAAPKSIRRSARVHRRRGAAGRQRTEAIGRSIGSIASLTRSVDVRRAEPNERFATGNGQTLLDDTRKESAESPDDEFSDLDEELA